MNSSSRALLQPYLNNSLAIRQEIQRFESVHPSIYAIYDLIDVIPDGAVSQQIRDHVVCIEDSFVNSQEWTLSRTVPDLRLGIVGSLSSGKSALVHRYLTGSYMQEESPEGGRFKKEILVDNQSFLLLIRDEGGPPELQFTAWVDAVIFVFSLENESSFNAIYNYYTKMSHYRNSAEIPLILVGTQDAISENNPRVIDDSRARKLANDLKRCTYYETCATYGLNVERVFQDACQKIVQQRLSVSTTCLTPTNSRPSTPNNHFHPITATTGGSITTQRQQSIVNAASQQQQQQHPQLQQSTTTNNGFSSQMSPSHNSSSLSHKESIHPLAGRHTLSSSTHYLHHRASADKINCAESLSSFKSCVDDKWNSSSSTLGSHGSSQALVLLQQIPAENNNVAKFATPHPLDNLQQQQQNTQQQQSSNSKDSSKDLPTPSSTPTTARKSRRRSNLFAPSKKNNSSNSTGNSTNDDHHNATHHNHSTKSSKNNTLAGDFGSGRAIPLKQGYLYKRSSKPLNKEWKKKYVTLCDDGRLTYHPSLHDYMDNVHGKEISLQYVTVKVPGQKPRGSKSIITVAGTNNSSSFQHHNSHLQNGSSSGTNTSSNSGGISEGFGGLTLGCAGVRDKRTTEKVLLSAFEAMKDPSGGAKNSQVSGDEGIAPSNSSSFLNGDSIKQETPNVKKRHRRMKSSGVKNSEYDDPDGYEFYIVSLDNKQWHFEASSSEERDEWVAAIEQQILNSLQLNESNKGKQNKQNNPMEATTIQAIRTRVPGNGFCVDCDAANPDWASLNLGVLMCIECSGIHRNLGSHISRVRSLDLDEWPPGHLSVMLAIGNSLANSVWESRLHQQPSSQPLGTHSQHPPYHPQKPTPCCGRELKERFIRAKYEAKEFLQPLSNTSTMSLGQQLVDAVCSSNIKAIIHLLALATPEEVNSHVSPRDLRTPLHLACAMGNLAVAQLLIWHNANVKAVDQDGRTCLAYARAAASIAAAKLQSTPTLMNEVAATNSRHLVDLLLSYGCPEVTSSSTPSLIGGGLAPAANMSGGGGGAPGGGSGGGGTLPRRRGSQQGGLPQFEKLPSSVI